MIHIHARTPDGVPSYEVEDFRAITDAILGEVDDVIINYSTGAIGVPIEKRIEYLRELRPDVAALNMGSMNYAKYSKRRKEFVFKTVFENSFDTIIDFLKAMNELGIKPEHECFDSGHVANLDPLLDMGLLHEPLQISCVMGVTGGIRPTARNLAHMSEQIPGGAEGPNDWGVIGISRDQWMLVGGGAHARRQRPRRPRGQLLPAERRDGALERRPDREGAPDGRGRGPARRRRSPRRASCSARRSAMARSRAATCWRTRSSPRRRRRERRARGRPGPRPHAAAAGRLLHAAARRPRRRRPEGRGHRHGRLHPLDAALLRRRRGVGEVVALPRAQPQQALDAAEPQGRARPRGAAAARRGLRRAGRVLPARRDGPARRRLRAPARGEPARSSTARSPATARTARYRAAPATTRTTSA